MKLAITFRDLGDRMRRYWEDEAALRLRLVSIGHLLAGNAVGSVLGLFVFIVAARALGPQQFGVLALCLSYVRGIQLLIGFQTWQPLIKYGAEFTDRWHATDFRSLMKFGLLIDIAACVTMYVIAVGAALLFGSLFGVGGEALSQVVTYSSMLLFQITGLPTAVMRLAGRYKVIAYLSLVSTSLRLVFGLIGLVNSYGLDYFIVVWTLTQIFQALLLLGVSFAEMHVQGVRKLLWTPLTGVSKRFAGLWSFTIGSSVELTIRSSANELDTLLVGALLGATPAGLYHIAKRFARLVLQFGTQAQAVLYPDVARLWAQGDVRRFRRAVLQMEALLGALGLGILVAVAFVLHPILHWTVGAAFEAAAPLVTVQMIAVAMTLSGSAARLGLLAMGRQPLVLKIVTVATLAFHVVAILGLLTIGAMGANVAHVVLAGICLAGFSIAFHTALKGSSEASAHGTDFDPGNAAVNGLK